MVAAGYPRSTRRVDLSRRGRAAGPCRLPQERADPRGIWTRTGRRVAGGVRRRSGPRALKGALWSGTARVSARNLGRLRGTCPPDRTAGVDGRRGDARASGTDALLRGSRGAANRLRRLSVGADAVRRRRARLRWPTGAWTPSACRPFSSTSSNPIRVVAGVERVLKPNGVVYAETPFMQQVHEGAYDFTRFTELGHRWLWRRFSTIARGPLGGRAVALLGHAVPAARPAAQPLPRGRPQRPVRHVRARRSG